MEQGVIGTDYPDKELEVVRELIFSTKVRAGAVLVGLLLMVLGVVAIVSRPSLAESLAGGIIALIGGVATVMLWFRQRYAIHAWAFLAATIGLAVALLSDPGHHRFLYWGGRVGTALFLGWFAYLLFRLGKQLTGHDGR